MSDLGGEQPEPDSHVEPRLPAAAEPVSLILVLVPSQLTRPDALHAVMGAASPVLTVPGLGDNATANVRHRVVSEYVVPATRLVLEQGAGNGQFKIGHARLGNGGRRVDDPPLLEAAPLGGEPVGGCDSHRIPR